MKKEIVSFGKWFLSLTGLYAAFAVCPFCGRSGCPVGLASAGAVGAFFASCMHIWHKIVFWRKKEGLEADNKGQEHEASPAQFSEHQALLGPERRAVRHFPGKREHG
jgi:hypothetical protein